MFEEFDPQQPVSWSSKGNSHFEFKNLSKPEVQAVEAALLGASWIRVHEGRIQFAHAFEQPPKPTRDPDVGPFWPGKRRRKEVKIVRFSELAFSEPHLQICHVGAAGGKDAYQRSEALLESYGFECCRSRRGPDGKFWEIFYLPSLILAEGDLAKAIGQATERQGLKYGDEGYHKLRVEAAITFLCQTCNFGTLDVGVQRAALTYD